MDGEAECFLVYLKTFFTLSGLVWANFPLPTIQILFIIPTHKGMMPENRLTKGLLC